MQTIQVYWWGFCRQWNIPNALSASRIFLGATIPVWWQWSMESILLILLWAAVSDGLDGWWARRFHQSTTIGQVFDPLADKFFMNPVLVCVAVSTESVVVWLLCAVNLLYDIDNTYRRRSDLDEAFRGTLRTVTRPVTYLSKVKTAGLFGFTMLAVLSLQFPALPVDSFAGGCLVLVVWSWSLNRRDVFRV